MSSKRSKEPNILWITSDQQHWSTLGCVNPEIRTPNLDRLAEQGVRFTRAYCTNPTCTPSRASMITGKYPSRHGAWALGTKLPESEPTLGGYLSRRGYGTAIVGKAHFQQLLSTPEYPSIESVPLMQDLGFWKKFHGPFYGFDHVELVRNHVSEYLAGQHYALWMENKGFRQWRDYFLPPTGTAKRWKWKWPIPEEYHYDTWVAERTVALMRQYRARNAKFFLWASFPDPHPPYLVPEPWDAMYDPACIALPERVPGEHRKNPPHFRLTQQKNPDFSPWRESGMGLHGFHTHRTGSKELAKNIAVYYGMISMMDKYIGRILDALDELGLAKNTLVMFTTDHGHLFGQHGMTAKGAFHYEDLIRVPMIVRWPGVIPEGRVSAAIQSLVDLPPTMLTLAGTAVPRTMSGVCQGDVWKGRSKSARQWALVENRHEPTTIHMKTYVERRYKITIYFRRDYGELFDLQKDPGETNNLWNSPRHAALKAEMTKKLLFAEMEKEPLWMPRVCSA